MAANYTSLADIYSHVMRRVRYDRWSEYLFYLTKARLCENPKVLELASGECSLARLLIKYYPDLITTDLSYKMLLKSKCSSEKVCCDMKALPFKNKFDLIYSTFDSVNYLTRKSQLLSMFKEVARVISRDGIFTFDASMELNSFKHIEEPLRKGIYNGIRYIHFSEYNAASRVHKNTFRIFDHKGNETVEIHRQKIYPFETYFETADKAGLYVAECYKAFSFTKGSPASERLQFILKKPKTDAVI